MDAGHGEGTAHRGGRPPRHYGDGVAPEEDEFDLSDLMGDEL